MRVFVCVCERERACVCVYVYVYVCVCVPVRVYFWHAICVLMNCWRGLLWGKRVLRGN